MIAKTVPSYHIPCRMVQAVQAAQITVEDYVLRDIGVAPLTVVRTDRRILPLFVLLSKDLLCT